MMIFGFRLAIVVVDAPKAAPCRHESSPKVLTEVREIRRPRQNAWQGVHLAGLPLSVTGHPSFGAP